MEWILGKLDVYNFDVDHAGCYCVLFLASDSKDINSVFLNGRKMSKDHDRKKLSDFQLHRILIR